MDKVEEIFYKIAGVQPPKPNIPKPMAPQKPATPTQNPQAPVKPGVQQQIPQTNLQQKPITQQQPVTPQQAAPTNPAQGQADFVQQSWDAMTPEQQRQIATMPPRIGVMPSAPGYAPTYDPRVMYSNQIAAWQKANPASKPTPSGNIGEVDREMYDPDLPNTAWAVKNNADWHKELDASRKAWPQIQADLQDASMDYVRFPEGIIRKDDPRCGELYGKHIQMNPVTGTPLMAAPAGAFSAVKALPNVAKGVSRFLPFLGRAEKALDTAGVAADVYNGIADSNSVEEAVKNVSDNLNQSAMLGTAAGVHVPSSMLKNTGKFVSRGARAYKNEENARNVYNVVANE